ncbi:MAG: hypothetical protein IKE65_05880, partial [Clostridia bacterium]|nr:hypothetical protein [Clostridia bacterium]
MKAKSLFKREIAFLLVAVLLFTCWVFVAPHSTTATAGNYTISIDAISQNDGDCKGMSVVVYYKPNNGTGTQTSTEIYSRSDNFTFDGTGNDDRSNVSIAGFPTKVEYKLCKRGGAYSLGTLKGYANITINGTSMGSTSTIDTSSEGWHTATWTATSAQYPYAKKAASFSVTNKEIPTSNSTTTTVSIGTITDQYGVNWYQDGDGVSASFPTGVSASGKTITIASSAMLTASPWYKDITLTAKCGSTNLSNTTTLRITNPNYTVTYKWHTNNDTSADGNSSTTQTGIYYNQTPTAPTRDSNNNTIPTAYYTTAKHYTGGSFSPQKVTSTASTRTNKMNYTETAHSYVYSEIANDDSNHLATCKVGSYYCGYTKNVAHSYGAPVDKGNGYHTETCGTTGCGHVKTTAHSWGAWQIIPEAEQNTTHAGHDRMAKHFRVCACGAKDYDNHSWVAGTPVAPTCTEAGYTSYECSQCHQTAVNLNQGDSVPANGHSFAYDSTGEKTATQHTEKCPACNSTRKVDHSNYGAWYSQDGTYHAHDCGVCNKAVTATHDGNWSGWQHEAPLADDENAVRRAVSSTLTTDNYDHDAKCFNYCAVCAQVKYQNHSETSATTREATCTEKGITTYTCSACGNARTDDNIPATGHDYIEVSIAPTDNTSGKVVCSCNNCGKFWKAQYNQEEHKYEPQPGATTETNIEEAAKTSDPVPAPYFNNYVADFGGEYNYADRLSSLRLMKEPYSGVNTTQDIRFSGSLSVPYIESGGSKAYVSYAVDPSKVLTAGGDF